MKPNAVFSNLIARNENSNGQSNISLSAPSAVNVHSDESNRAIQNLNSRFAVDETAREKTPADFLRQIIIEQPIGSSNAKPEPLEMKLDKPPQKLTAADYNRAAWRAVFKKAGYGILTDGEIQQAVGAMRDNKLKTEFEDFNIDNLRRYDAEPGPMFLDADKGTIESAKRAGQAVLQYQEYKAKQSDANQEKAQNEVNQMFADQGRVLWNSTVNIAEGIVNTAVDAALTNGGTNPLPLLNPNRPQADFSSAKSDYRSEMMRRNLEGKLDGDGIKRGEFTEAGVTIIAPIVVGAATTPKAAPQSLKTLGGLPEETTSASITTSVVKKVENAAEIVPPNAAKENAADFYRQAGWQQSRIDQHLAGIDFTKPVDVITIPKGTEVIQYQVPGKPVGNYFAPPGTTASELGMNPAGRQPRTFTTIKDMQVLRSTASPAVDTWSNAGKSFQTQGGGTQYFAPNASDLKPKL